MTDTQLLLSALIHASRFVQLKVRDGLDAASAAALRSVLTALLRELDSIECEAYSIAESRGMSFDGLPPLQHLFSTALSRMKLHFRETDSCVSEILIQCAAKASIAVLKAKNRITESPESGTALLTHRFLGCMNASARSLQEYL